jgi:membrane protease YdiL (CAAX protease family)
VNIRYRLNETRRQAASWLKRDILKPVLTSTAAWCFAVIWTTGAVYLAAIGRTDTTVPSLCLLATIIFFCVITVAITKKEHKPKVKLSQKRRSLLLLQIAVIALFICMTLYTSLMFHSIVDQRPIPVWSDIIGAFSRLGERVFTTDIVANPTLAMANPAQYFLLPLLFLLLLGANFRELGFCRGHRTLSIVALWCFIPAGVLIYLLAFGHLSCRVLIRRWLSHLLINGFGEEFLLRGALQTRLRVLLNPSWAIVIQALTFGIWHFAVHYNSMSINGITAVIMFSPTFAVRHLNRHY